MLLSKEELRAALWPDVVVEENNLGQAISKLRQALGESPGDNKYIATVSGRGYRFVAPVTVPVPGAEGAESSGVTPAPVADTLTPREREREARPRHLSRRVALAVVILIGAGLAGLFYVRSSPGGLPETRAPARWPCSPSNPW
ncbi:MAG TPA: winged helix-turn-helix domain-containing protein [Vicinamibacterales bacterium]|nr:winged helix-turn-helix domain-containing protein [Vicinamibacterales bacterium]